MVLVENVDDPVEQHLALLGSQVLDMAGVLAESVDGFPSGDGVGSYNGELVSEVLARVVLATSLIGVDGVFALVDNLLEFLLHRLVMFHTFSCCC